MNEHGVVTIVEVVGISGAWGRQLIKDTLSTIAGVHSVRVDIVRGEAAVIHEGSCHSADLARALARAGVRVGGVTTQPATDVHEGDQ